MRSTGRSTYIPWLLAVCLGLLALACVASPDIDFPVPQDPGEPDSWYSLYFTDPGGPAADTLRGGPDAALVEAIDGAFASVDLAIYELNLFSIRDALMRAQRRGLAVRVVMDNSRLDADEVQDLIAVGIQVVGDDSLGLMHNKFTILDRHEVWTGSMNLTVTDAYLNNNNLLRLRSESLAEDYLVEFEEMFTASRFGASSPSNTPDPSITVEGTPIQVCFAPEDSCLGLILEQVRQARSSINFLAFSFTSDALADALLAAQARGVKVSGVMETEQVKSNEGGEYERLDTAGLDVRLDGNPRNMHHKVIIIDGRLVVMGSYNFSRSAETRNDENVLVIENLDIARAYATEFEKIYAETQP